MTTGANYMYLSGAETAMNVEGKSATMARATDGRTKSTQARIFRYTNFCE